MLRKFKKCITDIKEYKYFNYFGLYFREEAGVDSDFEQEEEKANKTVDKLINKDRKKGKDLVENHLSKRFLSPLGSSDSFDSNLLGTRDSKKKIQLKDSDTNNLQSALMTYVDIKKRSAAKQVHHSNPTGKKA